ncbi:polysaccharide lyase family 8 super-sandwich domain-containing protein [Paenibacillus sp. PL2-23]|uniref:polysaccharide lyase family 8 super-sandwich domain-containing protein n=1 Tax=Paenibacillus sp. PL2-23 TaxID=2100729 RepID=UPI0030FB4AEE
MRWMYRLPLTYGVVFAMLFVMLGVPPLQNVHAADEFDDLREKWKTTLTGGTGISASDPHIAARVVSITAVAQARWDSMDTSPTRTYLWSDITGSSSSNVTSNYDRLREMALAYAVKGSALENDSALLADLVDALDWMYANQYNATKTGGNWWDWQIGAPLRLNDIVVLLYDQLSASQIANYMNTVNHFSPTVQMDGANRVWKATVVGVRGIIVKDGTKIAAARNGMSNVFNYVTSSDGFYLDGSFIQHGSYSYAGGYGASLIRDMAAVIYLLENSTWEVTDSDRANIYKFIYDSYEPFVYKGLIMDMTRGRDISRKIYQDHVYGHRVIEAVIRLSQIAPLSDADRLRSMAKYWIQEDTYRNFFEYATLDMVTLGKAITGNSSITPRGELVMNKQFPRMDRTVHLRPDFGFGISMHSSTRTRNFESINSENTKGWHTADGMTYLYNQDLAQFSDDFWPTVNSYRLPGTTVQRDTTVSAGKNSDKNWVGGVSMQGLYGVTGMELHPFGKTLEAKKSWFMFDDEIVALGAGIVSSDLKAVETIVENRKLGSAGNNAFTVNGTAKPTTLGWTETMTNVDWAHLAGHVAGADIGYYFPEPAALTGLREARSGNWSQINNNAAFRDTTTVTRNYMTLFFDHGTDPTGAAYEYVILPNKSSSQVSSYASNPDIEVLANTSAVQSVKERNLGIVGAAFWTDSLTWVQDDGADYLSSNKKAAVMTKTSAGELEVSVSDPTQANTGTIELEIKRSAISAISTDPGVVVTQLAPTIKLTVDVQNAKGKTFTAKFALPEEVIVDNAAAEKIGSWTTSTHMNNYYGDDYYYRATGNGSIKLRFRPNLPAAGDYKVYYRIPDGDSKRATNAPFTVYYSGGSQTYAVNQQVSPGGSWVLLGTHAFAAGTSGYVELTNAGNNDYVIGDAIKFVAD